MCSRRYTHACVFVGTYMLCTTHLCRFVTTSPYPTHAISLCAYISVSSHTCISVCISTPVCHSTHAYRFVSTCMCIPAQVYSVCDYIIVSLLVWTSVAADLDVRRGRHGFLVPSRQHVSRSGLICRGTHGFLLGLLHCCYSDHTHQQAGDINAYDRPMEYFCSIFGISFWGAVPRQLACTKTFTRPIMSSPE